MKRTLKRSLKRSGKRSGLALVLVVVTFLAVVGTSLYGQGQSQNQAPVPVRSRADETLDRWNDIGNKLVAMAQDFPEDKYDFKLQKDQRTFAQNLLHEAAFDYVVMRAISGSNLGPDFGKGDNPSRDDFKTKADVVKFVQQAVADGANVIQQQGDAGLDKTTKLPWGNRLARTFGSTTRPRQSGVATFSAARARSSRMAAYGVWAPITPLFCTATPTLT